MSTIGKLYDLCSRTTSGHLCCRLRIEQIGFGSPHHQHRTSDAVPETPEPTRVSQRWLECMDETPIVAQAIPTRAIGHNAVFCEVSPLPIGKPADWRQDLPEVGLCSRSRGKPRWSIAD